MEIKEDNNSMEIEKGMLILIVSLAIFAGPGAMHIAQMIGLLKVDIAITPTDLPYDTSVPVMKRQRQ